MYAYLWQHKNPFLNDDDLLRARYLVKKDKPLVRAKYVVIWPVLRILCFCFFKQKNKGWRKLICLCCKKFDPVDDHSSDEEDSENEKKSLLDKDKIH